MNVGTRSKRILGLLGIKGGNNTDLENKSDSDEDPYASDRSTDYIPSTDCESSPDEFMNDSPESPIIPFAKAIEVALDSNNEIRFDSERRQNTYNENETCMIPTIYEFENSLTDKYFFNDEIIERLKEVFGDPKNCGRQILEALPEEAQKTTVWESPLLIPNKYKKTICKYCEFKIISKHFARHLQRNHSEEREVKELEKYKLKSSERKKLLAILRNDGNLDDALRGAIIPKPRPNGGITPENYVICVHCKGYFCKRSLTRHVKKCFVCEKSEKIIKQNVRPLNESIIYTSCQKHFESTLNTLMVKKEIFNKMQPDAFTSIAIGDVLIVYFGEDLLKKSKIKRSSYHISNKLRECARFLCEMRKMGSYTDILSTLKPECFDDAIQASKRMSRFDTMRRSFGAPSLALHFRTTLISLSDLAEKLIIRKRIALPIETIEKTLMDLKRFRKIVDRQWATEIGSLALKDLTEKTTTKPKLLPITEDIIRLKKFLEEKAEKAYENLKKLNSIDAYKVLAETTLVSTILHNRKRVGDIQYLDLKSYKDQINNTAGTMQSELATALTQQELILSKHYGRITTIGKGSRPVTVLIPKNLQKHFFMLSKLRSNSSWFSPENHYFFTYPKSLRWMDGCSVIRKYANMCGAKHPELLTSCRLRKHIATVTQVLSLKPNEVDQLAKFMGHTTRTHENFYKLPENIYQVAQVSKILQLMERGSASEFKNKSLDEIDIDMEHIDFNSDQEEVEGNIAEIQEQSNTGTVSENNFTDHLIEDQETVITNDNSEVQEHERNLVGRNELQGNDSDIDMNEAGSTVTKPIKKRSRQRWTTKQKNIMRSYFKNNIRRKIALKKKETEDFIVQYEKDFINVTWIRVKTFTFNEYNAM